MNVNHLKILHLSINLISRSDEKVSKDFSKKKKKLRMESVRNGRIDRALKSLRDISSMNKKGC